MLFLLICIAFKLTNLTQTAMKNYSEYKELLIFIREALYPQKYNYSLSSEITLKRSRWNDMYNITVEHGIAPFIYDYLKNRDYYFNNSLIEEKDPVKRFSLYDGETNSPPEDILSKWRNSYEKNERLILKQNEVAQEISLLFSNVDIPVLFLNGFAFARFYPNPNARIYTPLDIYCFDKFDEVMLATKTFGIHFNIKRDDFCEALYKGIVIRFHKNLRFSYFPKRDHKSKIVEYEKILLDRLSVDKEYYKDEHLKVLVPKGMFYSLYLSQHLYLYYKNYGLLIRHFIDRSYFALHSCSSINCEELQKVYKDFSLLTFLETVVQVSKKVLGFSHELCPLGENVSGIDEKVNHLTSDTFFSCYRSSIRSRIKKYPKFVREMYYKYKRP